MPEPLIPRLTRMADRVLRRVGAADNLITVEGGPTDPTIFHIKPGKELLVGGQRVERFSIKPSSDRDPFGLGSATILDATERRGQPTAYREANLRSPGEQYPI